MPTLSSLNIEQEKFEYHVRAISAALQAQRDAASEVGVLCKAAKADGIDVKALKDVLKVKREDPKKTELASRHKAAYAQQLGVADQLNFFEGGPQRVIHKSEHPAAEVTESAEVL